MLDRNIERWLGKCPSHCESGRLLPVGQTTGDWRGSQAPGVEIPPGRKCCSERSAATYILGGRSPGAIMAVTHRASGSHLGKFVGLGFI